MKSLTLITIFVLSISASFAQSKSFQTLRDHFSHEENVHTFSISGFFCRAAITLAIDEEDELLSKLMNDIDHVRFMVIPKVEFEKQNLSVNGFKNYLAKDAFEEMMSVKEKGGHVSVFMREEGNNKNRYFVLVEESDEVVAIEMKGHVDPQLFKDKNNRITFNQ